MLCAYFGAHTHTHNISGTPLVPTIVMNELVPKIRYKDGLGECMYANGWGRVHIIMTFSSKTCKLAISIYPYQ